MEYEPYAGLFVSDGTAFDDKGVGQDEDTYIFAKLNNGLYMNTVPITIRSNGLDHALRLGSLICFGKMTSLPMDTQGSVWFIPI